MPGRMPDIYYYQLMDTVRADTLAGRSAATIAINTGMCARTITRYRARLRARGLLPLGTPGPRRV